MLSGTTGGPGAAPPIPTVRERRKPSFWFLDFYGSAVGKKAVMAVTGIILLGFVFVHMVGNLKVFLPDAELHLNAYGEYLRNIGEPIFPHTALLWIVRSVLILSFVLHIHAATTLTILNRKARPVAYKGGRDYAAATYAARTMRWSGIIVLLYLVFHLMDLTWGNANPDFVRGEPYNNLIESLQRWPVALIYIVANLALGLHIYHGAWSLFQSLGWNNPRFNIWRKRFAQVFAAIIVIGNVSIPVAVLAGAFDDPQHITGEAAHIEQQANLSVSAHQVGGR